LGFLELEDRLAPAVSSVAVIPMAPMAYGGNTTLEAAVTPNPGANGTLTFYDNGSLVAGASAVPIDASGIGMFQTAMLPAGNHTITAVYNGSLGMDPSPMSAPVTQAVNPAPLTITANNQTNTAGNSFTFMGNEFTASGLQNGETVGNVTFATPMGGTAASDAPGSYPIQISAATGGTFNPNNYTITYMPGTFTLSSATSTTPTAVALGSLNSSVYGSPTTISATVGPNPGMANGTVSFFDNGVPIPAGANLAIDNSGMATFQAPNLSAGNHSITAVYNGGTGFAASMPSPAQTQTVTPAPLTLSGITVANKPYDASTAAQIDASSAHLVGVMNSDDVSFNAAGSSGAFTDPSVGAGKTVNISGITLNGAAAGNYVLMPLTATGAISQGTATTSLAASPTATTGGGLVTFTATVPNGTGTVTFMENGTALNGGANVPLVNGTATYSTSSLAVGSHNVTASYNGDTNLAASASGAQTVTVNAASNQGQPQVVSATPNSDLTTSAGDQRSSVNDVVVTFDQPVQLDPNAITLALHGNVTFDGVTQPAGYGTLPANVSVNTTDNKTYVVTISGNTDASVNGLGSLKDGVYDLNVDASKVHAMGTGATMAGNYSTTFYRLFGSTGGANTPVGGTAGIDFSARITSLDNFRFRQAFNNNANYLPYFDFNGNGAIDSGDNLAFRTRFNKTMTWSMNSPTA